MLPTSQEFVSLRIILFLFVLHRAKVKCIIFLVCEDICVNVSRNVFSRCGNEYVTGGTSPWVEDGLGRSRDSRYFSRESLKRLKIGVVFTEEEIAPDSEAGDRRRRAYRVSWAKLCTGFVS